MPVDSPEDLYGLPLDRFIPERAALVKALRSEKRREQASTVAELRKPSIAAWAVNQLVRSQPKGIQALFQAGDDLADAQAHAAAGRGGGDAMREATHRQRDAVRDLIEAAEGLLSSGGQALSQTTLERVAETLRAAAVDAGARRQVEGGCLTQELRVVGLAFGGVAPSAADRQQKDSGSTKNRSGRTTDAARNEHAERRARRERKAALNAADRAEAEARRAAARAGRELASAQAQREGAAASLEAAEARLAAAAQRAEESSARLEAAEQALRGLA